MSCVSLHNLRKIVKNKANLCQYRREVGEDDEDGRRYFDFLSESVFNHIQIITSTFSSGFIELDVTNDKEKHIEHEGECARYKSRERNG